MHGVVRNLSDGINSPKLFLSCNDKDQYGFFHGAKQFVDILKQKKMDITWKLVGGNSSIFPKKY